MVLAYICVKKVESPSRTTIACGVFNSIASMMSFNNKMRTIFFELFEQIIMLKLMIASGL